VAIGGFWYFFGITSSAPKAPIVTANPNTTPSVSSNCQIIALGDSITAGYELEAKQAYPAQLESLLQSGGYPCTVVNAGVSGDTSKGLLDRLDFALGDTTYQFAILTI
jgi:acyl-CoA thioesterase-1